MNSQQSSQNQKIKWDFTYKIIKCNNEQKAINYDIHHEKFELNKFIYIFRHPLI